MLLLPLLLAMGTGCLWVAAELIRSARQYSPSTHLEDRLPDRRRRATALSLATFLVVLGAAVILLTALAAWLSFAYSGFTT